MSGSCMKRASTFETDQKPRLSIRSMTEETESQSGVTVLRLEIDKELWEQVQTLDDAGPDDKVYMVSFESDGTTRVAFGDGQRGRRLPSGGPTITVSYRVGSGTSGNVVAATWASKSQVNAITLQTRVVRAENEISIEAHETPQGCLRTLFTLIRSCVIKGRNRYVELPK